MKKKIFSTLRQIIQDVNAATGLEQALIIIVEHIRSAMKADAVSVYLRNSNTKQLVLMATDGLNRTAIGKIKFETEQGLVGLVLKQTEPINVEDAHSHPDYCFITETNESAFHGFLGVPIIQHRKALGVLVVRQTRQRRFSADEETFLVTLAAQLAGAISHAEKMGEVINLKKDVNQSFLLKGLGGSPGIAIGTAQIVFPPANLDAVPDNEISEDEVEENITIFSNAVLKVAEEFKFLSKKMEGVVSNEELALFDVYGLMLKSDSLIDTVVNRIKERQWAQGALRETITEHVKQFDVMEDPYLRERANDIKDLGRRLLMHLQTQQAPMIQSSGPVVLVGEEINVSQFAEVVLHDLVAIVSKSGSGSSHVAILARALGIPSVMGIDDLPVNYIKGEEIAVDGYSGQIYVKPTPAIREEYLRLAREEKSLNTELKKLIDMPSMTLDNVHIPLNVNTGLLEDITPSLQSGAEGVGLYRTEIPFLVHNGFPGEDEQSEIYRQVLQRFAPRPVVFRTLDIGGDKALPYFPIEEDNPFLGWRGIRVMLDHPELFLTQIRAILKVNQYDNNLRLMLPMISDVSEVDDAIKLIKKAHSELLSEGINTPYPSIGIMIEVPSAIYQIKAFSKRVDFFSIGSNDLTQYLLAVDRNNKNVASLYNSMHPSVLTSIKYIIDESHKYNRPISVCGEMAGNPASALALVGMGVDSLSMSSGSLLRVKWTIRSFTKHKAEQLVNKALALESYKDIDALFTQALIDAGLSGLTRAGN